MLNHYLLRVFRGEVSEKIKESALNRFQDHQQHGQDGKLGVWPAQQTLGQGLTEDLRNNRTHEMIGHFESGNPLRRPPRCSIQNNSLEYRFVLRGL
jgi:hypothetical protein